MKKKWTPFWFEGNLAWGKISTAKEWERIKVAYPNMDLSKVKNNPRSSTPYFGFKSECNGNKTLDEFFKKNCMKIKLTSDKKKNIKTIYLSVFMEKIIQYIKNIHALHCWHINDKSRRKIKHKHRCKLLNQYVHNNCCVKYKVNSTCCICGKSKINIFFDHNIIRGLEIPTEEEYDKSINEKNLF